LGMVIATTLAYFYTFWPINKLIHKNCDDKEKPFIFDKKEILAYALPTTLATMLLVVSLNMDIIIVKHYFSATDAGIYAAISTIAKIILYGTAPIITVMFPLVSERIAKGDKHYRLFIYSLIATLAGALLILGIYVLAPTKVITVLYGQSYTSMYHLLPQVGLFVVFYTLINLIANYFLAIRDFTFLWFCLIIIVAQPAVIAFWHPSIQSVVRLLVSSTGLLFASIISYYLFTKKDQLLKYIRGEYGEKP